MSSVAPLPGQTDLDIPGLVRHVRVQLRLTQSEFGALLGVRQNMMSQWECGRKAPPLFKLRIIQSAAEAVERGRVPDLHKSLADCGPAYALWRVLDMAYHVEYESE